MRKLSAPYLYVKHPDELNPRSAWVMQTDCPGFCGFITEYPRTEKGEESRREFLARTNLALTGKAKEYRVYATIQCTRESFAEAGEGIEQHIKNIASEMADFYASNYKDRDREKYID